MDIRTRKIRSGSDAGKYRVTATEGKGANRVTCTATVSLKEDAVRVAVHGCVDLTYKLKALKCKLKGDNNG